MNILSLFRAASCNCLWHQIVGGETYCFTGHNKEEILKQMEAYDSDVKMLYEINEISETGLHQLLSINQKAREQFLKLSASVEKQAA